MRRSMIWLAWLTGISLAWGCQTRQPRATPMEAGPPAATSGVQIEGYALEDQHGQLRDVRFPSDQPLFLTLADRSGSRHVAGWVAPIQARFGDRVRIEGVADLRGVPGLLRGIIRAQFRRGLNYPVGLDWDGQVIQQTAYGGGQVEALVIDTRGRLVCRLTGEADPEKLETVGALLDSLLVP